MTTRPTTKIERKTSHKVVVRMTADEMRLLEKMRRPDAPLSDYINEQMRKLDRRIQMGDAWATQPAVQFYLMGKTRYIITKVTRRDQVLTHRFPSDIVEFCELNQYKLSRFLSLSLTMV